MNLNVNNSTAYTGAMSDINTNKTTDNNSNTQNTVSKANDYSPVDTVEISEEAKAAANNAQLNAETDLEKTLKEYQARIQESMATTHEDVKSWYAYHGLTPGKDVITADSGRGSDYVSRNGSVSSLFGANKNDSYLQELSQKLGLTDEQNKKMTELIFNQFNRLTNGMFEVDNTTYENINEKILTSMKDLLSKFTDENKINV